MLHRVWGDSVDTLTKLINEAFPSILDRFTPDELFDFVTMPAKVITNPLPAVKYGLLYELSARIRHEIATPESDIYRMFAKSGVTNYDKIASIMLFKWQSLVKLDMKVFLKEYIESGGNPRPRG